MSIIYFSVILPFSLLVFLFHFSYLPLTFISVCPYLEYTLFHSFSLSFRFFFTYLFFLPNFSYFLLHFALFVSLLLKITSFSPLFLFLSLLVTLYSSFFLPHSYSLFLVYSFYFCQPSPLPFSFFSVFFLSITSLAFYNYLFIPLFQIPLYFICLLSLCIYFHLSHFLFCPISFLFLLSHS